MTTPSLQHIDEVISHCIHCGLCLPVCPTYALTQNEQSSPRGRIRLMRSVRDGSLGLTHQFINEMNFCLDCQACQTACPAGVQYGSLVEDARRVIADSKKEPWQTRFLKFLFLRGVLPSRTRTRIFGWLLWLYRASGLFEAITRSRILTVVSRRLHARHSMLPPVDGKAFGSTFPEVIPPRGEYRGRVIFLSGCIMNISFADIHRDSIAVLTENGYEVVIPKSQVCCGSLHGHNGDVEMAKRLARTNVDVFASIEADALVVDSAGCSAFVKEYDGLLSDDTGYSERAKALSQRTRDITEFLVESGFKKPSVPQRERVTYHEACHLVHTQKISREPREIIQSIPGIEFRELQEATWCCGSAGIYNILRIDDSMKLLDRKMNNIRATNADIVVTANPGCHLQLQCGIEQHQLSTRVMHPVSLLAMAYQEDAKARFR